MVSSITASSQSAFLNNLRAVQGISGQNGANKNPAIEAAKDNIKGADNGQPGALDEFVRKDTTTIGGGTADKTRGTFLNISA